MKKLMKFARHYQGTVCAVLMCAGLFAYMGCESEVESLITPSKMVNRAELQFEIETLLSSAEFKAMSLDKQDALRQAIGEWAIKLTAGQVTPLMALPAALSLLGIGATVDNRKKDALIKSLKNT